MTVQCITHGGGGRAFVYDITVSPPRLHLGGADGPIVRCTDGMEFDASIVEDTSIGIVVRCEDKYAPGGYVHFTFTGEHDPRPRPPIPESSASVAPFKVGDRVHNKRTGQTGTVSKVDGDVVYSCFGFFTMAYRAADLESVGPPKAEPPQWNVGDSVRSSESDNGQADISGTIEDLHTHGAYVRTDVGGVWYIPYGGLRRVPQPWKAEPPLTVTAERYCPQQFVMNMTEVIHAHECKAHGSEQFQRLASDLEQVRVLARANWIAGLPKVEPGENEADYAARVGMKPPPKNGRRGLWLIGVIDVMLQKGWAGR